jgi:23S rRNA (adenine1618-N6)-methyltransferase
MRRRLPATDARPSSALRSQPRKAVTAPQRKLPADAKTNVPRAGTEVAGLHPRSRHHGQYDLTALVAASSALKQFIITTRFGQRSINFSDPAAVKALNQALLKHHYGIQAWDLPDGYLCPPIPGRADYLHHVADLLANGGAIPRGAAITALDIGVGASVIYPLIGHREYGWTFVGTECTVDSLAAAQRVLDANVALRSAITLRRQRSPQALFAGVVHDGEHFDVSLCNPPFHASAEEASAGTRRKWHQLGKHKAAHGSPVLNFGGRQSELWCEGGEVGFITRMIKESAQRPDVCLWFTSLVSKEASVPTLIRSLQAVHARERRVIDVQHGQKRSRILAWTFLDERQRRAWRDARWRG